MRALILMCFLFSLPSHAVIETYRFATEQQRILYDELVRELRCVVCQNQNLIDSNAPLAQDLRQQIYQMVQHEQADKETVIKFMTQRYGDFVLYKPPLQPNTVLLWFAPLLMLLLGVVMVVRFVRQTQKGSHD